MSMDPSTHPDPSSHHPFRPALSSSPTLQYHQPITCITRSLRLPYPLITSNLPKTLSASLPPPPSLVPFPSPSSFFSPQTQLVDPNKSRRHLCIYLPCTDDQKSLLNPPPLKMTLSLSLSLSLLGTHQHSSEHLPQTNLPSIPPRYHHPPRPLSLSPPDHHPPPSQTPPPPAEKTSIPPPLPYRDPFFRHLPHPSSLSLSSPDAICRPERNGTKPNQIQAIYLSIYSIHLAIYLSI